MNIISSLKKLFSKSHDLTTPIPGPYDAEKYIREHLQAIEKETLLFIEKYGSDFSEFFYRETLDLFIRSEILPFRQPELKHNHFLDQSYWKTKHPCNFPGPFYTGESDTCGTGDTEAPNNVLYDEYAMEFIFRQPKGFSEFLCVIDAAAVEVLDSYSSDGNKYWTYTKCKEWWQGRFDMIVEMNKIETRKVNGNRADLYAEYLGNEAENDLRKYCYFLENGRYPVNEEIKLPQLG